MNIVEQTAIAPGGFRAQRRREKHFSRFEVPTIPRLRDHAHSGKLRLQPKLSHHDRPVRADLNPRANLPETFRLLENHDIDVIAKQAQGCSYTSDAGSDDDHLHTFPPQVSAIF